MNTIKISWILLVLAMMFIGCAKDGVNGAPGKDGTAGVNGVDGSDGTNGTNGSNGADGEDASPQRYYDFDITFLNPSTSEFYAGTNFGVVSEDAMVLLYWMKPTLDWWVQTPYIYASGASTVDVHIWAEIASYGSMAIKAERYDEPGVYPWANTSHTLSFRAVIVEPVAGKRDPLEGIDTDDYNAVAQALGL